MSVLPYRVSAARTALLVPGWIKRPIDRDVHQFKINDHFITDELAEAIIDGSITETMEGASSFEPVIHDPKGTLKNGILKDWCHINPLKYPVQDNKRRKHVTPATWKEVYGTLDGRDYALAGTTKSQKDYTLKFQNRGITELEKYSSHKLWYRDQYTRAEAIQATLKEVKGYHIPFYSPELHKIEPIASANTQLSSSETTSLMQPGFASSGATGSFVSGARVTYKGQIAGTQVLGYMDRVLRTGVSMGAPYPVLVSAIMCVTQESDWVILRDPVRDGGIGLFSQLPQYGWPATGDNIEADAGAYYKAAIANYKADPNQALTALVQSVQRSAFPDAYAQWETESRATVNTWLGHPGATGAVNTTTTTTATEFQRYAFERGKTGQGENSWVFDQRLAQEVAWYLFFLDNTLYYVESNQIMRQRPLDTLRESDDGIDYIDWDIDSGKRVSEVTIYAHVERWQTPPGAVVIIEDEGPPDGTWLVHTIRYPLYGRTAEITLNLPTPPKPEPAPTTTTTTTSSGAGGLTSATGGSSSAIRNAIVQAALYGVAHFHSGYQAVRPIPSNFSDLVNTGTDCSGYATLCYKEAGAPDPNGNNYNGDGNTGEEEGQGVPTSSPQPGDLCFWSNPDHVAIYIGGADTIVEWGGGTSPIQSTVSNENGFHSAFLGYRSYLP